MDRDRPFISVIIPHLNQPGALARCLESLAAQTFPRARFEVILADNGSEPPPVEILGRFEGARLVTEPTPGPGPARNRGVAESRGEILAFIDADCVAERGWLAAAAERLQRPDAKVLAGGDVRIAVRDPGHLSAVEAYESVFAFRQRDYIEKMGFSGAGNLAVRRRDFEAIGPFGGIDMAEDRDWGRRATGLGYRILFVPEMIVWHPARPSFGELYRKWDRHIGHDFRDWRAHGRNKAAWVLRAAAVAVSPLAEVPRVVLSGRISGRRTKALALAGLIRTRSYRAGRMIRAVLDRRLSKKPAPWNRS